MAIYSAWCRLEFQSSSSSREIKSQCFVVTRDSIYDGESQPCGLSCGCVSGICARLCCVGCVGMLRLGHCTRLLQRKLCQVLPGPSTPLLTLLPRQLSQTLGGIPRSAPEFSPRIILSTCSCSAPTSRPSSFHPSSDSATSLLLLLLPPMVLVDATTFPDDETAPSRSPADGASWTWSKYRCSACCMGLVSPLLAHGTTCTAGIWIPAPGIEPMLRIHTIIHTRSHVLLAMPLPAIDCPPLSPTPYRPRGRALKEVKHHPHRVCCGPAKTAQGKKKLFSRVVR